VSHIASFKEAVLLRRQRASGHRAAQGSVKSPEFQARSAGETTLGDASRSGKAQPEASNEWLRRHAARFVIAGGAMAVFYMGLTSLLALMGVPFQAALILSFLANVALHFTLQRVFVWPQRRDYALALHHQLQRYLPLVVIQYVLTVAATATLPGWLDLPVLAVYIGITVSYTVFNFLFFRSRIFHVE
jgi:putative flippase GtrA